MSSTRKLFIATDKGDIYVVVKGDATKPAIITYHDLGVNYDTNFVDFFNYPVMRGLLENFCVYHVTAPGQDENAPTLPDNYIYPTMDELASQLICVLSHFGLKSVIGFGAGAGANILSRFALKYPDKVDALCLINCVSKKSSWIEWGYQSLNAFFLRTRGMTQIVIDYMLWYYFGYRRDKWNHDMVATYKQHFEHGINPKNLAKFINSYIHRNNLNIKRNPPRTLKIPVISFTGDLSPHVDDTINFNEHLDPKTSSFVKIFDCALVMEEPDQLAEGFRFFLQGEGYVVNSIQKTTINDNLVL